MEFIILFLYLNLINSLTLAKYDTIELDLEHVSMLFDSSDFFLGDDMIFKFKTKGSCESNISYDYYDDFNEAYKVYETQFQAFSNKKEIKEEYEINNFRIRKDSGDLNGLNGKYLLIKYNCTDAVEITNINPNLSLGYIVLIVFACIVILFGIGIMINIVIKKYQKKKGNNNNDKIIKKESESQNNNNQNIDSQNTNNQEINNNSQEINSKNQEINSKNQEIKNNIQKINIQDNNSINKSKCNSQEFLNLNINTRNKFTEN